MNNWKVGNPTHKNATKKLCNTSADTEEEERIDAAYDLYYKTAIFHCASEHNRKIQLNNIVNRITFLQKKIDDAKQNLRDIKRRKKLISFLENYEHMLKSRINRCQETDSNKILDLLQEFQKGVQGLPIANIQLPQTETEKDFVVQTLHNMSKDLKVSAIDLIENLKESRAASVSLDECKQASQKNITVLKDLITEEAFWKLASNYKGEPTCDIADLISD